MGPVQNVLKRNFDDMCDLFVSMNDENSGQVIPKALVVDIVVRSCFGTVRFVRKSARLWMSQCELGNAAWTMCDESLWDRVDQE